MKPFLIAFAFPVLIGLILISCRFLGPKRSAPPRARRHVKGFRP